MTSDRDLDRLLDAFLADGPQHVSDRTFQGAVDRLRRQGQRPAWRLAWRSPNLSMPIRLAAASVAVVAVIVVAVGALQLNPLGVGSASPSPAATPSTAPSPSPSPAAATAETSSVPVCLRAGPCLGALAAGTHTADLPVTPFSYTVPLGWYNDINGVGAYKLHRTIDGPTNAVDLLMDVVVPDQASCSSQPDPDIGHGVGDILTFLTTSDDLTTSAPIAVSLGGLDGQALDVQVRDGSTYPCSDGVSLFVHPATIKDDLWWFLQPGNRMRLTLLDAGGGHTVAIVVQADFQALFDVLIVESQPVVDSLDFTP